MSNINPKQQSILFRENAAAYLKVNAVVGGTEAMRLAEKAYLPQGERETDANYKNRLNSSVLVPFYREALDNTTAAAMKKELIVTAPAKVSALLNNVDGSGSSLDQYAAEQFWTGLHYGTSYTAVEFPKVEVAPANLAEARAMKAQPYFVSIKAPQIIAAHSKYEHGQERLTHFRWLAQSIEPNEDFLDERIVETVKAYTQPDRDGPVRFQEWKKDESSDWVVVRDEVIPGVTQIPVRCSYFWRTGFYVGKPVFSDLADLNIVHWQSTSEQRFILSVARIPFLHIKGDNLIIRSQTSDGQTTERVFEITPHQVAMTPKDTDIAWVEHGGQAIQAGADDLEYLEKRMKELSRVLLTEKSGDVTATATAINSAEAQTTLKSMVVAYTQDIEHWLKLMAMYLGESGDGIKVEADTSIEMPTLDGQTGEQNTPPEMNQA